VSDVVVDEQTAVDSVHLVGAEDGHSDETELDHGDMTGIHAEQPEEPEGKLC